MMQALRYEPHGQRQRFEPREQQGSGVGQRHIHLHLHVHLNLVAQRPRVRHFLQPTTTRVTAIFAAFMGALSMALSFTVMSSTSFPFVGPHIALAGQIMFIGALIGSSAVLFGGLPLVVETWRSAPRSRLYLSVPLLVLLILAALTPMGLVNVPLLLAELLLVAATWRPTWGKRFCFALLTLVILTIPLTSLLASGMRQLFILLSPWLWGANGNPMITLLFYGIPLVSTIAIVRAIRWAKLSDNVLRFTTIPSLLVVGGMLLIIGGMLLWAGTVLFFLPSVFPQILALLTLPYNSWLLQFIGMLIALVMILRALFSRSHARAEARPKDASSADVMASRERGYFPVDGTKEEKPQEEL
jgi:hypothetical protein